MKTACVDIIGEVNMVAMGLVMLVKNEVEPVRACDPALE